MITSESWRPAVPIRRGTLLLLLVAAAAVIAPGAVAASDCVGLTCERPGSPNDVPQARDGSAPSVWGPRQLEHQANAGFYEFGLGALSEQRAVGYVLPAGQLERVPASVRDLPAMVAIEEPGGHPGFDFGTLVILGPDVVVTIPSEDSGATAARRRRIRGGTAAVDAYGCEDLRLCLYELYGYTGRGIMFGTCCNPSNYWINLGQFGFNDAANSMRSRRNNDSRIAEHNYGGGARYCADSNSSDSSLANNDIGVNRASSVDLKTSDGYC
jgi:hypothetical protein